MNEKMRVDETKESSLPQHDFFSSIETKHINFHLVEKKKRN